MDKRFTTTTQIISLAAGAAMLATSVSGIAQVELDSKGMTITGQRELPKVLYIVPWKKMNASEIEAPKTSALVADVLDPIDPEIFKKRLRYFDILSADKK